MLGFSYTKTMKSYLAVAAIAMLASSVKSTQVFNSNYNLLSSPFGHQQMYSGYAGVRGPHAGIVPAYNQQQNELQHPAVVQNSIAESQLPAELLNPFYKNPVLASALAQESWFTNKEFPVHHRDTERISREEIYKIVSRLRS